MENLIKFNVKVDKQRNTLFPEFARATLKDRYLLEGEDYQDMLARVAGCFGDSQEHAQRIYEYMSQLWFMPATPILSNGGTKRGLPISCFVNEAQDSLKGMLEMWNENAGLAALGGGVGTNFSHIRSLNEKIGFSGRSCGIMPFMKVLDAITLTISQGPRPGSMAVYLDDRHPEIMEFLDARRVTKGDLNRRSLNLHHGVILSDEFMCAMENGSEWELRSPKTKQTISTIQARDLWEKILTTRVETGEPYILFIDNVNRAVPEWQKKFLPPIHTSNLCSEILQPTGIDFDGKNRTAVCCLSSVNLEHIEHWRDNKDFIPDIMRFLDNVLQYFIDNADSVAFANSVYSASSARSVGLGVMGWMYYCQKNNIPMDSVMAKVHNIKIFEHLKRETDKASIMLADERGPCPDAARAGVHERFSHKMAVAPTASISDIAGQTSPSIEMHPTNSFIKKTLSGSFHIRNKYLEMLLDKKGLNTASMWSEITMNDGSIQGFNYFTEHEKAVFKTAYEIDQMWLLEQMADRTKFVDQGISFNVFLPPDIHKQYLHSLMWKGWKMGIKSFYYNRSIAAQRPDKIGYKASAAVISPVSVDYTKDSECISCE